MRFWVGGYTADMDGAATGVGELRAGAVDDVLAGGPLGFAGTAASADGSPSWLVAHPTLDVVYAALEGAGAVQAFRRTGEASFEPLGEAAPAGELVCHVAVAPDAGSLVASCWGDGRVVRMRLDAAGRPSDPQLASAAADPYAEDGMDPDDAAPALAGLDLAAAARAVRDAAGEEYAHLLPRVEDGPEPADEAPAEDRVSRAHQALFLPAGDVATTDMGFDQVRFWRPTSDGLRAAGRVVLPRGSGPRHMRWHPSGHLYVVTELSREVFVLRPDESGSWRLVSSASLSPALLDDDLAAEIALSRDARFVVVGVRGSNAIATLRVSGEGDRLSPLALADSGVDWPRHHVVLRDTVLVAGQRSDEVASLTLDERTGVPGRVRHRTIVPSPTCLLPAR
ncbi:MAG: beta-propeller fold lactonase family protein [Microbacterium sp.]